MCARKSFVRAPERTQKSARQIRRRVGAISRAARWLWKVVVSHENGYIQTGNDPTASHLLLTISVCTKIVCKSSWTHAKICSTNKATSRRYFSSSSTNKATSWRYFSSRSMTKKTRFSHENGYIQAWNDPTASHLLLTISVCTKIVCKRSWTRAKICSTNKATSRRYFSSSSTNKATSWRYFSSRSMAKKTRCFSWKRIHTSMKRPNSIAFTTNN